MSDPADTPRRRRTLRERERDLELRASLIDTRETTITYKQSARIILRAASYLRYFVGRSAIKLVMTWIGQAMPIFVLTWFGKILIDHVVLGVPIEEAEQYPAYMTPRAEHAARLLGVRDHDLPRHRRCRPHAPHGRLPRLPRRCRSRLTARPGLRDERRERPARRPQQPGRSLRVRGVHDEHAPDPSAQPHHPVPCLPPHHGAVHDPTGGPAHRRLHLPGALRHTRRSTRSSTRSCIRR